MKLVQSCVSKVNSGKSLVSQMIMGAGKTSTILPLLALFLTDGQQMVMQVVPLPLLAFTRALMRERFSSVIAKPVHTFAFERASAVDIDLLRKLEEAVTRRAVVLSTPAALKSFALRFIENMHDLDYMSRAVRPARMHAYVSLRPEVKLHWPTLLLLTLIDPTCARSRQLAHVADWRR